MSDCKRIIQKFFLKDDRENIKRNYIWNTVAGLLNAAEAVILSMIIMRITGLSDTGILTIAFAIANLLVTVGKYGVRSYQITDSTGISFRSYLYARYVSVSLMIFFSIGYLMNGMLAGNYSLYKSGTIFFMCLIFAVEALEDVFWGYFHKAGRLDVGAKMFIIRWSGILLIYSVGLLLTQNLFWASVAAFSVSLILFWICKKSIAYKIDYGNHQRQMWMILKECLPLCLSGFLNFYICNAPKYAIDKYMDDETQACFGFVAMPVFVIELLSTFLYQPMIVNLSVRWNQGETGKIAKGLLRQILIIVGLTIICVSGAYLVGIPVLSLLFGTDLQEYKKELLLMVSGGGGLAIANFMVVLLTMMRKQIYVIICYVIVALSAVVLLPKTVIYYHTRGAAIMNDILITVLFVLLGAGVIRVLYMKTKNTV